MHFLATGPDGIDFNAEISSRIARERGNKLIQSVELRRENSLQATMYLTICLVI